MDTKKKTPCPTAVLTGLHHSVRCLRLGSVQCCATLAWAARAVFYSNFSRPAAEKTQQ